MIGSMFEVIESLPGCLVGDGIADTEWHQCSRGYRESFKSKGIEYTRGFVDSYDVGNVVTRALGRLFMTRRAAMYRGARKLLDELEPER